MLNLWLTFDYELFMGRNYVSEEEILMMLGSKVPSFVA